MRDIVCEEGKKAPAGCSVLYNVEDMKTGAVEGLQAGNLL